MQLHQAARERCALAGAQIEAQLRRLRIDLPNRFEFETNQPILNMVAEGDGWAITTPASYMRARRFQRQINLIPFPGKGFSRAISGFVTELHDGPVCDSVVQTMRRLVQVRLIAPAVEGLPWLSEIFTLLPKRDAAP